jgi:ribosomal protein S18 acetylase RimI-like enzyme
VQIVPVQRSDRAALLQLAVDTGLFTAPEADGLLGGVLDALAAAELAPGHEAVCCRPVGSGSPQGWCYFAPDDHAAGVWNVWWLGVSPHPQGSGVGQRLLAHAEARALAQGGRLMVIETSDADPLARARRFYAASGYLLCGSVPHFYGDGEAKVIFARHIASASLT